MAFIFTAMCECLISTEEDRSGQRGACWWCWLPLLSWAPRPALLIISHPEAEAALSPWPAVYLFQTQDSKNLGEGQTSQGPRWQKSCINLRLLTLSPGQERLETEGRGWGFPGSGLKLNPKPVMALIFVNQSLQFFFTLLAEDMFPRMHREKQ